MSRLKEIEGYPLYFASEDGRIISKKTENHPIELKSRKNRRGYLYVNLCKNGKYRSITIHRLIAKAFLEEYDPKLQVNHKDGNKENNNIQNLEMVTMSQNIRHAIENNLLPVKQGEEKPVAKLKNQEVLDIRELWKTRKYSQRKLAEIYGVSRWTIKKIVEGQTWKFLL